MALTDRQKQIAITAYINAARILAVTRVQAEHIYGAVEAILAEQASAAEQGQGGVALIAAERRRQIKGEGWTLEHDDAHKHGELAAAASCYAHHANCQVRKFQPSYVGGRPSDWPWEPQCWKPSNDPIRNLTKAGALIAAEIDRLHRETKASGMPPLTQPPIKPSGVWIISDSVANLLCNCAQLLDTIKSEWGAEWSDWDQEQRDSITRHLQAYYETKDALAQADKPRSKPAERVTIGIGGDSDGPGAFVYLDNNWMITFRGTNRDKDAERYANGLREEIKGGK